MTKLLNPGRNIFAAGIAGLGILCILHKDFIVGRPPAWPAGVEVNPLLGYVSGTVLVLLGLAIIARKKADLAALAFAALILILSLLPRHLPNFMTDWLNSYKALALLGGALIVAASFSRVHGPVHSVAINEKSRRNFILIGSIFLAIFFVACGYAHFKFADFVTDFIPSYIPFPRFWAYFCGVCLVAGGIGILIPQTRKLAALLSGVMVFGWFILLHIPRFLTDTSNVSDRLGLVESFTIAGIFFVLAGIFSEKK